MLLVTKTPQNCEPSNGLCNEIPKIRSPQSHKSSTCSAWLAPRSASYQRDKHSTCGHMWPWDLRMRRVCSVRSFQMVGNFLKVARTKLCSWMSWKQKLGSCNLEFRILHWIQKKFSNELMEATMKTFIVEYKNCFVGSIWAQMQLRRFPKSWSCRAWLGGVRETSLGSPATCPRFVQLLGG